MPHSYPRPNPPPYPPIPSSAKRPSLPSIASSSLYLTPIQEQRILSWRTHTPPSPLGTSPVPTPDLTASISPTTGTASSTSVPNVHPADPPTRSTKKKVKSAPASMVAPPGAAEAGLSNIGEGARADASSVSYPPRPRPSQVPQTHPMSRRPTLPPHITPISSTTDTMTGTGTGTGSRQRSYYSTKPYRQAKAAAMREQNGYASGTGTGTGTGTYSGGSGSGMGRDPRLAREGNEGGYVPGPNDQGDQYSYQYPDQYQYPPGTQPDWGLPDGGNTPREPLQERVPADPIVHPTPRIGGARDPVSQHYWRNKFPPVGGPTGLNRGMPMPMMGMGMGMFHPPMMGMPGMMPFH